MIGERVGQRAAGSFCFSFPNQGWVGITHIGCRWWERRVFFGGNVEYKSFYKSVGGNEGEQCKYSTRLDTYGCGCSHDCSYCYAKSLLSFRGLWNPSDPASADIEKIRRKVKRIPKKTIRLGGMTDCFQPVEKTRRVTYEKLKALNENGVPYLIVTKSPMVADPEYLDVLDKNLAHIQFTLTFTDDERHKETGIEKAPLPTERIKAIEKLQANGYDVAIRLSPYIPEFIDIDKLNRIQCDKVLVEFLRVNHWIRKWLGDKCDLSGYTRVFHGYSHLPFEKKLELVERIGKTHTVTVCDFEPEYLHFWKKQWNPNPDDCCNLRAVN